MSELVVKLNVHNVAKAISCNRFWLVPIVGFGGWHFGTRGLLHLRLLVQLLLRLLLVDIGACVEHWERWEARHIWIQVAYVAVADIRRSGSYTRLRRLLAWVSGGELVAICGSVVNYGQVRAIIRIWLPHRAVADWGRRLNRICVAVPILVKLVVTTLPAIIELIWVLGNLVDLLLERLLLLLEVLSPLLCLLKLLEECSSVVASERVVSVCNIIKCIKIRLRNHWVSVKRLIYLHCCYWELCWPF